MSPRTAGGLPIFIKLDAAAAEPLHHQVYQGLRTLILQGGLPPGARLPSTRMLAVDLGVSRNTVLNAFETLVAEGYLQGSAGGGTHVSGMLPDASVYPRAPPVRPSPSHGDRRPSQRAALTMAVRVRQQLALTPQGVRAFRQGASALTEFPTELWGRLIRRRWTRSGVDSLYYDAAAGYAPLREAIAAYLRTARGVICEPRQVLVVSGSQQALDLATRVLLDPGDPVWIEDPGYDGARGAFVGAGARLVPIPVDSEGLNVAKGIQRAPNARLAYVTPSHQFPLGITMTLRRRLELLHWASTSDAWVIEDDYDSEYRYANRPIAALQGLDSDGCVTYTGTFSKVLFPALRLGYIVVPPALVDTFSKIRLFADVHTPTFMQAVVADFITEGHFERHVRRMRTLYRERQEAMLEAASRHLDGLLDVRPAHGGMHLLGWLPPGVSDQDAARRAAIEGVEVMPLSFFSSRDVRCGALLLGYTALTPLQIADGARCLAKALEPLCRATRLRPA
jgi:GntR family transcriptional regulator/MocR family aminotransferase